MLINLANMYRETKRLTYQEFDKDEDKLRSEGWDVVEVKQDHKIVILGRTLISDETDGILCELQKWLDGNVKKDYQKEILTLAIERID